MLEEILSLLLSRDELIELGVSAPPTKSAKRKRWDKEVGLLVDPKWTPPAPSLQKRAGNILTTCKDFYSAGLRADEIKDSIRRVLIGKEYHCVGGAKEMVVDGVEIKLQVDPSWAIFPDRFCNEPGCVKHQWPLAGWPPKNLDALAQLPKLKCLSLIVGDLNNMTAATATKNLARVLENPVGLLGFPPHPWDGHVWVVEPCWARDRVLKKIPSETYETLDRLEMIYMLPSPRGWLTRDIRAYADAIRGGEWAKCPYSRLGGNTTLVRRTKVKLWAEVRGAMFWDYDAPWVKAWPWGLARLDPAFAQWATWAREWWWSSKMAFVKSPRAKEEVFDDEWNIREGVRLE